MCENNNGSVSGVCDPIPEVTTALNIVYLTFPKYELYISRRNGLDIQRSHRGADQMLRVDKQVMVQASIQAHECERVKTVLLAVTCGI